jgi:hypothetical protein
MRYTAKFVLSALLIIGSSSTILAQQQACSAQETTRIDGLMQRAYVAGYQFAATGDTSILAVIMQESQALNDSLSPTCRGFLERWAAWVQKRKSPPPRITGSGGVQYDRATDTYFAPGAGASCSPRGCITY